MTEINEIKDIVSNSFKLLGSIIFFCKEGQETWIVAKRAENSYVYLRLCIESAGIYELHSSIYSTLEEAYKAANSNLSDWMNNCFS